MLTHLDLFSGIGGFALAASWAGFQTVGFVEIDPYCQKVLNKHWPDVPVVEDIRDVETIKTVAEVYQGGSPITLITGGFPCQPFSVAGKRGGKSDNRYLWPEMLGVISAVRPRWVLGENVAGIVRMELDNVLSDLEGEGYTCQAFVVPACGVNAPHRRERVWIVAYGQSTGRSSWASKGQSGRCREDMAISQSRESRQQTEQERGQGSGRGSQEDGALWNANSTREESIATASRSRNTACESSWWAVEPELGRVAHGIPNRVDRLKCLGNAIVPQVAYQILRGIAEIEKSDDKPRR